MHQPMKGRSFQIAQAEYSSHVLFKELQYVGLWHCSAGDLNGQLDELILRCNQIGSVQSKKGDCGRGTDSFVPIDKGMVAYEMEEICACHLSECRVQELSPKRGSGRGDSGFKKISVQNSTTTPVLSDLIVVDADDTSNSEKANCHSFCEAFERSSEIAVHAFQNLIQFLIGNLFIRGSDE